MLIIVAVIIFLWFVFFVAEIINYRLKKKFGEKKFEEYTKDVEEYSQKPHPFIRGFWKLFVEILRH